MAILTMVAISALWPSFARADAPPTTAPTAAPTTAPTTTAARTTAPTTNPAAAEPRNDLPGLRNFAKVSDVLYRGAQPTPAGFRELKKLGVKTVVNLRSFRSDREAMRGTGLRYVHIYAKAWHPEDEDTIRFLKVVRDPENHPVFVHCMHGADRTGCVVAAYRILEEDWSIKDAVAEMDNFGFHPIWQVIVQYLRRFDTEAMRKAVDDAPAPRVRVIQ